MNGPCPNMQDGIADYVLGALDAAEAEALREHLSQCAGCRQYLASLQQQSEALVDLGRRIGIRMTARRDRVIEALEHVAPAEPSARRVFPFLRGFLKTAVAAVLLLGAGIGIGRWTAPRPVDVEKLRSDLEASVAASIKPAVQRSVLSQVDQRLQAEAQQRAELAMQTHQDLCLLAEQSANMEKLMKGRFAELVDLIEAGRETDRWRVEKALQQMRLRTGLGLQALAVRADATTTTVQN
ncbi:MAG: zf-HC2 domain-containing protein [Sedimentisphaerales bacterium]|nr:zf-HC2 domain-containing protein [Sedimentisphaerales bacterium]